MRNELFRSGMLACGTAGLASALLVFASAAAAQAETAEKRCRMSATPGKQQEALATKIARCGSVLRPRDRTDRDMIRTPPAIHDPIAIEPDVEVPETPPANAK